MRKIAQRVNRMFLVRPENKQVGPRLHKSLEEPTFSNNTPSPNNSACYLQTNQSRQEAKNQFFDYYSVQTTPIETSD